jgi:hypothetical protein
VLGSVGHKSAASFVSNLLDHIFTGGGELLDKYFRVLHFEFVEKILLFISELIKGLKINLVKSQYHWSLVEKNPHAFEKF